MDCCGGVGRAYSCQLAPTLPEHSRYVGINEQPKTLAIQMGLKPEDENDDGRCAYSKNLCFSFNLRMILIAF